MGFTRVRVGEHIIGQGISPTTGQNITGKHGDVTKTYKHFDDDVVEIAWRKGGTDTVSQKNVSGTGQCSGRRGCLGQ